MAGFLERVCSGGAHEPLLRRASRLRPEPGLHLGGLAAQPRPLHAALPPHPGRLGAHGRGPVAELHAIQRQRLRPPRATARGSTWRYYRDLPPPSDSADDRRGDRAHACRDPAAREEHLSRARPNRSSPRDIPRAAASSRARRAARRARALPLWYTPETLAEEYATVWRLRRAQRRPARRSHISPSAASSSCPSRRSGRPSGARTITAGQTLFSLYHMTPENLPRLRGRDPRRSRRATPRAIRRRSIWSARAHARRRAPAAAGPARGGLHLFGVAARLPARDDRAGLRRARPRPLRHERVRRVDDGVRARAVSTSTWSSASSRSRPRRRPTSGCAARCS